MTVQGPWVDLAELQTRHCLIDGQLERADWRLNDRTQIRREVPLDGLRSAEDGNQDVHEREQAGVPKRPHILLTGNLTVFDAERGRSLSSLAQNAGGKPDGG